MFSYNEAYESSLEWFGGDELAAGVFLSKYALRDANGNYLEKNPDDMHRRMAEEFARIESKYPNPMSAAEIYSLFQEVDEKFNFRKVIGKLVPQGSPMSGIGNNNTYVSISNCFVIDSAEDSYGGIMFTDQEQAQIMKRRGGVGHDISKIRPTNIPVNNAAATSDGIEIFMDRFSNTTREVAQNGRRGALMLTISVHHPDVLKFITIKKDKKRVTGANVSVRVSDEFMRAVINDEKYVQHWPVDPGLKREEYLVWNETPAKEIWDAMMLAAWESAEPGILFWDTIINNSPADIYADSGFNTISTNPCGEIVLSAYDSCRLLAINLSRFVKNPFTEKAEFDWEQYEQAVQKAQRLMDSMIDLEIEKIDRIIDKIQRDPERPEIKQIESNLWNKIKAAAQKGRRTGTGITALGDVIAALNYRYGDQDSINFTEEIYKKLAINCYIETIKLAKERGAFPVFNYELEKDHAFLSKIISLLPPDSQKDYKEFGRRNIALTTTAPTGTVSVLTQTSSGIEPVFSTHYKRRRKINPQMSNLSVDFVDELGDSWHEYYVFHHWFKLFLEINNLQDKNPDESFLTSPYYKATANDVDWEASVDIQAKAQNWICHSISKTCNLPNNVTVDLVSNVYQRAWQTGCKGFTVYRDGSRSGVLISSDQSNDKKETIFNNSPKRPDELECDIHHVHINGEKWTVLVGKNANSGKPFELFGGLSETIELPKRFTTGLIRKVRFKSKSPRYDLILGEDEDQIIVKDLVQTFSNANHGAFTRTISLTLRHGVPINYLVEQLQKDKNADMFSFSKVIARCLKKYIDDGTKSTLKLEGCDTPGQCNIKYMEGCASCLTCGISKCS